MAAQHSTSSTSAPQPADDEQWRLRLYIIEGQMRHKLALDSLQRICEQHLAGRYDLEVIDIQRHPEIAEQDHIFATPTLVRQLPLPQKRLIGDLSNPAVVVAALGIWQG